MIERDVGSVTFPGEMGQFTALVGHDILIARLKAGRIHFQCAKEGGKEAREEYEAGPGIAEVTGGAARIFVESVRALS